MLDPATLVAWRKARGLSRRGAAELLGVNQRTLEGLEYGRFDASPLWGPLTRLTELLVMPHDAMADLPRTDTRSGTG